MIAWKARIGNCQWLLFVFVCRLLNTVKCVVCFYNCYKAIDGDFYTGGVLRGFDRFAEKAPVVGLFLNNVLRRDSSPRVFFRRFCGIFKSACLVEHERLLLYCFGSLLSSTFYLQHVGSRVYGVFVKWFFWLLLFASSY